MPNYFYYGLLVFTCLCLFGYTFWRIPDQKVFTLYAFIAGAIFLPEYVIVVLLNGYAYHPGILDDKYFDSALGAIISDVFIIPFAATFIGAFQLEFLWIAVITGIFLFIEWVFVNLGVYIQHWWSILYTGIVLLIGFLFAKKWYRLLFGKLAMFVRWTTLYCVTILLLATIRFALFAIFHLYLYKIGWFQDQSRAHLAFDGIYIMLLSIFFVIFVVFHIKWRWRIGFLLLLMVIDWQLETWGILHMAAGWNLIYFFFLRVVFLWLIEYFDKTMLRNRKE